MGGSGTGLVLDLIDHAFVNLEGVDLEVEVTTFDQGIDLTGQDLLQVTLTWSTAGVGGHHARHGCVGPEEGGILGGVVELIGEDGLKHGEQQMFLPTLVLVAVDGEHDRLQQRVDLGHGDETAEVSDVTGFGLQEEEQVPILLGLIVAGEESLLHVGGVVQVVGHLVLL